ncbi:CBS domain-containing protein [Alteromonadaceae bacterium BrNp21-10]|nr:CBS domain-containing protein [Alteromonadaceae bacterium BrNp21-10]
MSTYNYLSMHQLDGYHISHQSKVGPLELASPAIEIMVNFARNAPLMLSADMSIEQATTLLKSAHISKTLVKNKQDDFIGIVTLADLQSSRVLSIANKLGLHRNELSIANLMIPKAQCTGIQLQTILTSTIGEVLATMQHEGQQHVLIIAQSTMEIVGMISAMDIAKKLHMPIQITPLPTNFQEVMLAVGHP